MTMISNFKASVAAIKWMQQLLCEPMVSYGHSAVTRWQEAQLSELPNQVCKYSKGPL